MAKFFRTFSWNCDLKLLTSFTKLRCVSCSMSPKKPFKNWIKPFIRYRNGRKDQFLAFFRMRVIEKAFHYETCSITSKNHSDTTANHFTQTLNQSCSNRSHSISQCAILQANETPMYLKRNKS